MGGGQLIDRPIKMATTPSDQRLSAHCYCWSSHSSCCGRQPATTTITARLRVLW